MRLLRRLGLALAALALGFCGVTWWALEGNDAVRLHTRRADGGERVTRVWIAEGPDEAWVEAATSERPFYLDLLRDHHVEVERGGARRVFVAEAMPNPEGHRWVRKLLRDKYGWADVWIGMLQDTSGSMGVRLRAVPGASP